VMRLIFDNPFEAGGDWFKGNIHTHTTNSDGQMISKQVVNNYEKAGYDFLSITDHGVLTDTKELSKPGFLLIPGEEICAGSSGRGRLFHIVGLNIQEEVPAKGFDRVEDPQRIIDLIRKQGGTAILAHPYWSDLNSNDLSRFKGYIGVEVYNTSCDLTIGRGHSNVHWDDLLSGGCRLLGFAVDDAHCLDKPLLPLDLCKAWIYVKARSLTVESIMEGIRRGRFYSSNGPEIRGIEIEGGEIRVSSSPVRSIAFVSSGGHGENNTVDGGSLEEAVYAVRGSEAYVRIEITDRSGRKAWSNPIYVES
jgi:hypothetical protein